MPRLLTQMPLTRTARQINETPSIFFAGLGDSQGLETRRLFLPVLTRANIGFCQNRDVPDFSGAPDGIKLRTRISFKSRYKIGGLGPILLNPIGQSMSRPGYFRHRFNVWLIRQCRWRAFFLAMLSPRIAARYFEESCRPPWPQRRRRRPATASQGFPRQGLDTNQPGPTYPE